MSKQASPLVFLITIPANTPNATQIIKTTKAFSGIVKLIHIDIPQGWQYSAGLKIKIGNFIYPAVDDSNALEFFTGDDTDIPLHPNTRIYEAQIEFIGQNQDAVEDHSAVVTIEIEDAENTFRGSKN